MSSAEPTARTTADAVDLSGSDAFIRNSMDRVPDEFDEMVGAAEDYLPPPGGGARQVRATRSFKTLGPEHFCIMQHWGPFSTNNGEHMDLFLRRLIALQVQLLSTASSVPV